MRKQIAAANWKMNLTYQEAEKLLDEILEARIDLKDHQLAIFSVPFPYLIMANSEVANLNNYCIAAQNCYSKAEGAFTGEVSALMLESIGVKYCIVGHSERREFFQESNKMLAEKIDICLQHQITPIFCCGEPLPIREKEEQNIYVQVQLEESLFHLDAEAIKKVVIAYEPIWAIGTGKTASTEQAQQMHSHLRSVLATKFDKQIADEVSILYGGSVKAGNAKELFACADVDGGLVGGASLLPNDFIKIIQALKK
ncbi:MAG TPA: triose-phosphate isomerase [Chitinophagaceae bacterium]|nr:triose-phosphate isomerase [Chitinophagaceae bacterium]